MVISTAFFATSKSSFEFCFKLKDSLIFSSISVWILLFIIGIKTSCISDGFQCFIIEPPASL
jgi:hypothetical protein